MCRRRMRVGMRADPILWPCGAVLPSPISLLQAPAATSHPGPCPAGSGHEFVSVYAKYGQPPGWSFGQSDFRSSGSFMPLEGEAAFELSFDASDPGFQPGVHSCPPPCLAVGQSWPLQPDTGPEAWKAGPECRLLFEPAGNPVSRQTCTLPGSLHGESLSGSAAAGSLSRMLCLLCLQLHLARSDMHLMSAPAHEH